MFATVDVMGHFHIRPPTRILLELTAALRDWLGWTPALCIFFFYNLDAGKRGKMVCLVTA